MIAGASWMCCILSITEAGKQPEQPRSKSSRQFSISTIKLKSLAKLSKESRLRTTNEKGMTQIGPCYKDKKLGILWFWTKFPAQLYHCIALIPQKNLSQHTATSTATFRFSFSGNLGKSKWAERDRLKVTTHPCPFIREINYGPLAKDQNVVYTSTQYLNYLVPQLWYNLLSIVPCFFKNKTMLIVFWMLEYIWRKKWNIALWAAKLKQLHYRFIWSHP